MTSEELERERARIAALVAIGNDLPAHEAARLIDAVERLGGPEAALKVLEEHLQGRK